MRKSLLYSLIGIVAIAIIALGATLSAGNKPLLGLDLQGGASVVLQPQSKVDNGPDEWKYVAKGTCTKLGGKTAEEAKAAVKK